MESGLDIRHEAPLPSPCPRLSDSTNVPHPQPLTSLPALTSPLVPNCQLDKENPPSLAVVTKAEAPLTARSLGMNGQSQNHSQSQTLGDKDEMAQRFGALQGKLQSLKRESRRPSISGTYPDHSVKAQAAMGGLAARLQSLQRRESIRPVEQTMNSEASSLVKIASQLFNDPELVALLEKGLTAQLTRSHEGATDESKIRELASMVKTLRRGMKELRRRAESYVEQSLRFEKDATQQIQAVKLASESAARSAQAELAHAKREAASVTANHKTALASWSGELDLHRAEIAALKREVQRLEAEKEKAKEDVQKSDNAVRVLEAELKDAKKSQTQRERELQVDKNSTAQALYEAREAAERLKAALEVETERANTAVAAVESLTLEKASLLAETEDLKHRLEGESSAHSALTARTATLTSEAAELRLQITAMEPELRRLRDVEITMGKELEELRPLASQAVVLEQEVSVLKKSGEEAQWERGQTQVQLDETTMRLEALESELKAAVEEKSKAQEEVLLMRDSTESAKQEAVRAKEALDTAQKTLETTRTKLSKLEGELEALQECTVGLQGFGKDGAGNEVTKELLSRMTSKIAALETAVAAAEARRREAHDKLVELKGNIRVFCRVRPHASPVATVGPDGCSIKLVADGKRHEYRFDAALAPATSQAQVFEAVADVVQSALDGYKVCLFSYGQTGAGKTYTMQGGDGVGEEGIVPRSVDKILATVARAREEGWTYDLEASFVEVYNEQLRDLLGARSSAPTESLSIQHGAEGGHTIVVGATRARIESAEDAQRVVRRAAAARRTESTAMNAESSRSHAVFILYVTGRHEASGTLLRGSLNLVDLAGSERLGRSGAEGDRAKEACSINKSLSALGDVFAALATKASHIPYRNSKLTHLLQPCLGGSGKTLMFVNINPEPASAGESLCSLRFAAKVNACETAAKGGAVRNVEVLTHGSGTGIKRAAVNALPSSSSLGSALRSIRHKPSY
jgi:kinesin family protein C1